MNPSPSVEALQRVARLLAHEASAGTAPPAARVYDRLLARLAPLLGTTGVELMLVRSAKLAQGDFASMADVSILDGAAKLRERLDDPALSAESAGRLFAIFLTLLTSFIGDRLTVQMLRTVWPTLEEKHLEKK